MSFAISYFILPPPETSFENQRPTGFIAMPSMVVINCPHTGEEVPTGLVMDLLGFAVLTESLELKCPGCGGVHRWARSDAWLSVTYQARARSKRFRGGTP
jgi:hypothetical protein